MSLLLSAIVLSVAQPTAPASPAPASAMTPAESPAAAAARRFLELGDAARWSDAYAATGKSFHAANTLQGWTAAAQKVRAPMGAVASRTYLTEVDVPAPPAGLQVVKYRTRFADGREVTETVALDQEQGAWKVVGIYME